MNRGQCGDDGGEKSGEGEAVAMAPLLVLTSVAFLRVSLCVIPGLDPGIQSLHRRILIDPALIAADIGASVVFQAHEEQARHHDDAADEDVSRLEISRHQCIAVALRQPQVSEVQITVRKRPPVQGLEMAGVQITRRRGDHAADR